MSAPVCPLTGSPGVSLVAWHIYRLFPVADRRSLHVLPPSGCMCVMCDTGGASRGQHPGVHQRAVPGANRRQPAAGPDSGQRGRGRQALLHEHVDHQGAVPAAHVPGRLTLCTAPCRRWRSCADCAAASAVAQRRDSVQASLTARVHADEGAACKQGRRKCAHQLTHQPLCAPGTL
jgi:hypothetical protein